MIEHRAGQDVVSYCGKCKMSLAHVIHAVKVGIPARVECKTCGAIHGYRPHAPGAGGSSAGRSRSGSTPRTSKPRVTRAMRDAEEALAAYEKLVAKSDVESPVPYAIVETFAIGQALLHTKFGLGVVTRVTGDSKIEVAFRTGPTTLVHGRG